MERAISPPQLRCINNTNAQCPETEDLSCKVDSEVDSVTPTGEGLKPFLEQIHTQTQCLIPGDCAHRTEMLYYVLEILLFP